MLQELLRSLLADKGTIRFNKSDDNELSVGDSLRASGIKAATLFYHGDEERTNQQLRRISDYLRSLNLSVILVKDFGPVFSSHSQRGERVVFSSGPNLPRHDHLLMLQELANLTGVPTWPHYYSFESSMLLVEIQSRNDRDNPKAQSVDYSSENVPAVVGDLSPDLLTRANFIGGISLPPNEDFEEPQGVDLAATSDLEDNPLLLSNSSRGTDGSQTATRHTPAQRQYENAGDPKLKILPTVQDNGSSAGEVISTPTLNHERLNYFPVFPEG
jgi:hypothetical protein